MNDSILKLVLLVVGYLLIRKFLFKKNVTKKMSCRRRYQLRKKEKANEKE